MSEPRPSRLRWSLQGIAVALAIFGAAEGVARVVEHWHPPLAVDAGLGFDPASRLFVPASGAKYHTAPEKLAAFHDQTFAVPKARGTVRIVAIGESSVFNLQSELEQLAARLGARWGRAVEVINCGGNSYGSQRLVPIAREVLDYQPDVLVLYLGHNEFEELEQLELVDLRLVGVERAASHLALFRLVRDWLAAARVRKLAEARRRLLASPRPDWQRAWAHAFTADEVDERMRAFRRNVGDMVALARARGVKVVMATIPSNRWKPVLPRDLAAVSDELVDLHARGAYAYSDARARQALAQAAGRHQSSDRENRILREVAAREGVPLVDIEAAVVAAEPHHVPGETLFADHCHLNEAGNRIWAQSIEAALAPLSF